MGLQSLEKEFVISDLKLFREFDSSHLISNAKAAITGKVKSVNFKLNNEYNVELIRRAQKSLQDVSVNIDEIRNFLTNFISLSKVDGNLGLTMRNTSLFLDTTFKPQYISQYIEMVETVFDKILHNSASDQEIMRYISGEFILKVEKQVVRSNNTIPYGVNTKDLLKTLDVKEIVTADTINNKVLPFVSNFTDLKIKTIAESEEVICGIEKANDDIKALFNVVEKLRVSDTLTAETINRLNSFAYNAIRGLIEIVSYVSFVMVRKLDLIVGTVLDCEKIYNELLNMESFSSVVEGAIEGSSVVSTDHYNLGEQLIEGTSDAFIEASRRIYEEFSSIPSASNIEDPDISLFTYDNFVDSSEKENVPYQIDIYLAIQNTFLAISSGLDIMADNEDDYVMVYSDILKSAGLNVPLEERLKNDINRIEDVSLYTNSKEPETMKRILTEVKCFGDNMAIIGAVIAETYKKVKVLRDRFENNYNQEYRDTATAKELAAFLEDFMGQYIEIVSSIGTKFFNRLRSLKEILISMNTNDIESPDVLEESSIIYDEDSNDYAAMAELEEIECFEKETESLFRELEKSYYYEKELAQRGVKVVFEADNAQTQTTTTTQQPANNANQNTTSVSVQDNSNATDTNNANKTTANQPGALAKVIADIGKFISEKIQQFTDNINRTKAKNDKWLSENKEELMNRSYNNVTVNVLPYSNVPPDSIVAEIGKVTSAVKSMTPQNLQNIANKDAIYSKLFPFISGLKDANGSLSDQLVKYYKVRNADLKVVPVANGELKTQITTVIIPFCESYSGNFLQQLTNALNGLGKAVDDQIKSYGGSEVTESVSIFTEAETQNKNTETNISEKANWMRESIKVYTGSIMNAVRDRNNDYLKILSSLTPKTPAKPVEAKETDNTGNAENATTT